VDITDSRAQPLEHISHSSAMLPARTETSTRVRLYLPLAWIKSRKPLVCKRKT
jgi:hypothetical protein